MPVGGKESSAAAAPLPYVSECHEAHDCVCRRDGCDASQMTAIHRQLTSTQLGGHTHRGGVCAMNSKLLTLVIL